MPVRCSPYIPWITKPSTAGVWQHGAGVPARLLCRAQVGRPHLRVFRSHPNYRLLPGEGSAARMEHACSLRHSRVLYTGIHLVPLATACIAWPHAAHHPVVMHCRSTAGPPMRRWRCGPWTPNRWGWPSQIAQHHHNKILWIACRQLAANKVCCRYCACLMLQWLCSHDDHATTCPCNLMLLSCVQSPTSARNIIGRLVVTTIYCSLLTLLGCALPFFGSFLALVSPQPAVPHVTAAQR